MARFSLNLSVVQRKMDSFADVKERFTDDGWENTGSIGNRIVYLEKSGLNITVAKGPMATLIFPSGPIRGSFFGEEFGITSTPISDDKDKTDTEDKQNKSSSNREVRV